MHLLLLGRKSDIRWISFWMAEKIENCPPLEKEREKGCHSEQQHRERKIWGLTNETIQSELEGGEIYETQNEVPRSSPGQPTLSCLHHHHQEQQPSSYPFLTRIDESGRGGPGWESTSEK
jgi:hypothetical protein